MLVLTAENEAFNTDKIKVSEEVWHSVLKLEDPSCPDFYMDVIEYLEEFAAASIVLHIGEHEIVMPLNWSIVCTDMEYLHTIPLHEVGGKNFAAFCLNPIDGFSPEFLRIRTGTIFPSANWTAPQIHDKNLLVVPLGDTARSPIAGGIERGPICAMFSASKVEVYRPIGDIW